MESIAAETLEQICWHVPIEELGRLVLTSNFNYQVCDSIYQQRHAEYQRRLNLKNTILVKEMELRNYAADRILDLTQLDTQNGTGMRLILAPRSNRALIQPIPGHPQLYAVPRRHQEILDILNTQ